MVTLRISPELFQILGKLAHDVPCLTFLASRAAEQFLQLREDRRHGSFRLVIIGETSHPARFPYELFAVDAMDLAIGILQRHPHHFEVLGELRGDMERFLRGYAIAEFLEDRE